MTKTDMNYSEDSQHVLAYFLAPWSSYEPWPSLQQMLNLLEHLPLASISKALVNHTLHLPAISISVSPLFFI
jgi:hypothetical protein